MAFRRKGYSMPNCRTVKGEKYYLDSIQWFWGDAKRRLAELRSEGHKAFSKIEQHAQDTAGGWVIYSTKKP